MTERKPKKVYPPGTRAIGFILLYLLICACIVLAGAMWLSLR